MASTIPQKRPAETQEDAWVADEDRFVLRQAKKKALLRVRSQRAKPIDYLAVTLRSVDQGQSGFESEEENPSIPFINPETVFEGLSRDGLKDLEDGIDTYLALEKQKVNRDYWQVMKLVCKDRLEVYAKDGSSGAARGIGSVAAELDKVLAPKTLVQLEALEGQIRAKLRSDDDIDVDYWESLLRRLKVHEARQKLRQVARGVVGSRWTQLRSEQELDAEQMRKRIDSRFTGEQEVDTISVKATTILDPPSLLKVPKELSSRNAEDCKEFSRKIAEHRLAVLKAGFVVDPKSLAHTSGAAGSKSLNADKETSTTSSGSAFDREVAKGMEEDEEVFSAEATLTQTKAPTWAGQYTARKPQYFNRVQTGYEWSKYNQTHYDYDNPPPKVVQGYKFNIFYPDLIDKTKAPTYRIEREHGRRRGQLTAPAGEDDTCVIRFVAGPPYEDVAFRVVDKEWDYSAKYDRGFKSRFDKVCL